MKVTLLLPLALAALLVACTKSPPPADVDKVAPQAGPAVQKTDPAPQDAGLYPLRAVGMTFEGPTEIPSGWTTFRFQNQSPMVHFAMIDAPPESISLEVFYKDLMLPFQVLMDAMNAGDDAGVEATLASFPAWLAELGRAGGPGLLSPGLSADTTVFLEPGRYVLECYIKTNGVFHTTGPDEDSMGMVLEFTVTEESNGATEPEANAVVALYNDRIELVAGGFVSGANTIRVDFAEQQALPSFAGNDVHILSVSSNESVALAGAWMDWREPTGMESPSPVRFVGGIQDMPAGSHGYISVHLQAGNYALMGEVPDPVAMGLVLPFSVK